MLTTKSEVNLRRLLRRCEHSLTDTNGLLQPAERAKFAINVRYLEKLRDQVAKENGAYVHVLIPAYFDKTSIAEYTHKIQRLSTLTEEFKPNSSPLPATTLTFAIGLRKPPTPTHYSPPLYPIRTYLTHPRFFLSQLSSLHFDDPDSVANVEAVLQSHRQQQEELTNRMLLSAQRLKMNSATTGDIIKKDNDIILATQDVMGSNLTQLRKANQRLDAHSARSSSTSIMTWLAVGLVCMLFVVSFIVIRLFPKAK
ncbi:membrane fusion protein Use1-domain-containing protein [Jimgerdemannia flammicorona]|uniref:Membrane fusion protein Use1-domain-containing protein n=1 Tax=Jimgerdemannia flammicorona TaxID=994334 RepID=A0A433QRK3_9FUNG|nr:membrane fusion protein Use1-domain-containing protein [Jimgerdemannia flammicorona]